MKVLNQLFRQFTQALITSMIICTLVFLPYPANLNNAYAEDSNTTDIAETDGGVECDDGTGGTNGGADVYRVGCEFNEDLAMSKAENHYGDGTEGIVEQFVGAVFALIGVSLFFAPDPLRVAECPQNSGASISMPIVQAGTLAYLIGEISANLKFKEGSKLAVDHAFMEKQNENNTDDKDASKEAKKQNDKQMEAYSTLMKIYEKQVEGLDKKIQMATLAEIAFLSAFGIEVANVNAVSSMCTGVKKSLQTAEESLKSTLLTLESTTVPTEQAEYQAAFVECMEVCTAAYGTCAAGCAKFSKSAVSCGSTIPLIKEYLVALQTATTKVAANNATEVTENIVKETSDKTQNISLFSGMLSQFATSAWVPVPGPIGKAKAESAEAKAKATANDTFAETVKAQRLAMITKLESVGSLCHASIKAVKANLSAIEAGRRQPIHCCGIASSLPNLDTTDMRISNIAAASAPGTSYTINMDSTFYNVLDHNNMEMYAGISPKNYEFKIFKEHEKKFYVKSIVENTLRRIAYQMVEKKNLNSDSKKIRMLASSEKYIQYILENQDALLHDSNIKKEFDSFYKTFPKDSLEQQDFLITFVERLKKELVIDIANANAFKELLNIGMKVVMLYMMLNSWLQENAFPKPNTRMWTWLTMSALNGVVLSFDQDAKDKAEKRFEVTRKEAQRFANSDAQSFKIDAGDSGDTSRMKLTKQSRKAIGYTKAGVRACAVPKGSGFAPAMCPSVVTRQKFSFPNNKKVTGGANSPYFQAMGLLGDGVYHASSKGILSENKGVTSALSGADSIRKALKKRNAELLKEMDKREIKQHKALGKKGKPQLLSSSVAKARKLFSSSNAPKIMTSQALDGNKSKMLPELEKLKTDLGNKAKRAGINLGTGSTVATPQTPSFDFDLGDDSDSGSTVSDMGVGTAGEESLTDFQVNSGEINENTGVSIFKLISNRYLRSYPVLLEENKK